jgi:large subunit ribosomal protein L24
LLRLHVRKGDKVLVLSGKDKGKTGKVLAAFPRDGKVLVEGVHLVKRHSKAKQRVQAGIYEREAPLPGAKVMVICPSCQQATRIGKTLLADGSRARACRKCGAQIDR